MATYKYLTPPKEGSRAIVENGKVVMPDDPIVPFIEGDGIGPDIWAATKKTLEAAVEKSYGGKKRIVWFEVLAGEKAFEKTGEWLPNDTLEAIREYCISIKGPLTTPVGGGIRSLNVALRQILDLYACVRPVRYFKGVPSPVKAPEKLDVVIFRENTEDIYIGIEWQEGQNETLELLRLLEEKFHVRNIPKDSGIGVKPISPFGTKRLVKMALEYAIKHSRESLTLMHMGDVMKYTEGAFMEWGYEICREVGGDRTITEKEIVEKLDGRAPEGKIVIKDRLADAMFHQILINPDEYHVVATPNLNGDYLSDACAAQVGGLGMAPGANIGDTAALFEATHGTAPKYAGMDKVNPGSLMLSGAMMLEHMGWDEAAARVIEGIEGAIRDKMVTYDLERQTEGAKLLKCSEFGQAVVDHM